MTPGAGGRGCLAGVPGVALGLRGSLPQTGTVPPNACAPLQTTDVPGKAQDTTRACTRHMHMPWHTGPGRGTPSTPDHRVDTQHEHGLWRPGSESHPDHHQLVQSGDPASGSVPPWGRMEPALAPAWQAFLRLSDEPRLPSGCGALCAGRGGTLSAFHVFLRGQEGHLLPPFYRWGNWGPGARK